LPDRSYVNHRNRLFAEPFRGLGRPPLPDGAVPGADIPASSAAGSPTTITWHVPCPTEPEIQFDGGSA